MRTINIIYGSPRVEREFNRSYLNYSLNSDLKTPYKGFYVKLVLDGLEEKIWTIALNTESPNTPLVLLHGFAAGLGLWSLNLDSLSEHRPVYAIDILGFGRSSRTKFTKNTIENEKKITNSVEKWRRYMNLDKFFLLGHSMGGYLATSYTLSYPDSVKLLILCDTWGFTDKFDVPPLWIKILTFFFNLTKFNPLAYLRCIGPYLGPLYIRTIRDDIIKHFKDFVPNYLYILSNYLYQCNANPNSTGETAFYSFVDGIGWAKYPMVKRIHNLKPEIPMKILYGSDTWMDKDMGPRIKKMRTGSFVDVEVVPESEHHMYADQAIKFNESVNLACQYIENAKFYD